MYSGDEYYSDDNEVGGSDRADFECPNCGFIWMGYDGEPCPECGADENGIVDDDGDDWDAERRENNDFAHDDDPEPNYIDSEW